MARKEQRKRRRKTKRLAAKSTVAKAMKKKMPCHVLGFR